MDDYALVLNAGSSSLKFCVYRQARRRRRGRSRRAARSTASAPRRASRPRTARAPRWPTRRWTPASATAARRSTRWPRWLRGRYGGARVLGVGHRVVHGGAQLRRARSSSRRRCSTICARSCRSRRSISRTTSPPSRPSAERLPGVPQVACFDTSFHRGQPAVAELVPLPREIRDAGVQRYGFHGLSYEYIASVLPQVAPEIADGRVIVAHLGSGASLCALKAAAGAWTARSASPRSTGSAWARGPASVDPGVILYLFQTLGLSADGGRDDPLQEVGPARHLGHQQRHARPARQRRARGACWPWTTSSTARPRRSARSPPCSAASTAWCSPPASASTRPRSARGSARPRPGSASTLDAEANAAHGPANLHAGQPRLGLGRSHQRRTDDRPAHRRAAGHRRPRADGHARGV